ncbi:MAG: hypothetical protein GY861_11520 [bacterium]|nr:hypothetical protein [bacterium]
METGLVQRLITEIDALSDKVWDLAKSVHSSEGRIGVLQKIIIIIISGMVALTWVLFTKK